MSRGYDNFRSTFQSQLEWLGACRVYSHGFMFDRDVKFASSPFDRKRQSPPVRQEPGREAETIAMCFESGKAEHNGLPQASECGSVHAGRRIAHVVTEIDFGRLLQIGLGTFIVANSSRNQGVDRRTKRATVPSPQFVVTKIGCGYVRAKLIPQQKSC